MTNALDAVADALTVPVIAASVGFLLGAGLLLLSRRGFSRLTPENGPAGLAIAGVFLLARMVLGAAVLVGYWTFFRPGFAPFGIALATGFLALYGVELVRYGAAVPVRR